MVNRKKRIFRNSAIILGFLLMALIEHRILFGRYESFFTSASLPGVIVTSLVTIFAVNRTNESSRQDAWKFVLIAVLSAIALVADIYAFTTDTFVLSASLISAFILLIFGFVFVRSLYFHENISESGKRLGVFGATLLVCMLCIIAGLISIHFL